MEIVQRRGRGRPPVLSAEMILTTAFDLVNRTGELNMRDLGEALGHDATAAYRYFKTRSDLIVALGRKLVAPIADRFQTSGDWRRDVESLTMAFYDAYSAYPAVAVLAMSNETASPEALALLSKARDIVLSSGAPEMACFQAHHAIEFSTFGALAYDYVGAPHHLPVRRSYISMVGYDDRALFPLDDNLAAEARETALITVRSILDWLSSQIPNSR